MSTLSKEEYEHKINALNLDIKGGCNRCIYYKHDMNWNNEGDLISTKTCKMGHDNILTEWWNENGKKCSRDETTTNQCFEASIHEKALTNLNNTAKNLLDMVKKYDAK